MHTVHCDNEAVVASIQAGRAKETYMAHLLRCLFFTEAKFCCTITSSHVPGKLNERADTLSRNQLSGFSYWLPRQSDSKSQSLRCWWRDWSSWTAGRLQAGAGGSECSLAPSTTLTYNTGRNRYAKFCSERKIVPLPLTEKNLCEYMANLAQGDVKRQSIKCYLPAARHLQIMLGQGDPFREKMPLLEDVLWGIKSEQAKRFPTAQRVQLPITPDVLLRIRQVWEWHCKHPDNIMLWAAWTTCLFGFLRSGEITVPLLQDFDLGAHLARVTPDCPAEH